MVRPSGEEGEPRKKPYFGPVSRNNMAKFFKFQSISVHAIRSDPRQETISVPSNRITIRETSDIASRHISNTRDSVSSGYPNTEKRVENMTCSGGVWIADETLSRVFDISSQSKQKLYEGINREVKSSKYMLVKTGCPNLHSCDFLCFFFFFY